MNLKFDFFNTILAVIDLNVSGLLNRLYVDHIIAKDPYKK
jgi:hypothetical protein